MDKINKIASRIVAKALEDMVSDRLADVVWKRSEILYECEIDMNYEPANYERAYGDHGPLLKESGDYHYADGVEYTLKKYYMPINVKYTDFFKHDDIGTKWEKLTDSWKEKYKRIIKTVADDYDYKLDIKVEGDIDWSIDDDDYDNFRIENVKFERDHFTLEFEDDFRHIDKVLKNHKDIASALERLEEKYAEDYEPPENDDFDEPDDYDPHEGEGEVEWESRY